MSMIYAPRKTAAVIKISKERMTRTTVPAIKISKERMTRTTVPAAMEMFDRVYSLLSEPSGCLKIYVSISQPFFFLASFLIF